MIMSINSFEQLLTDFKDPGRLTINKNSRIVYIRNSAVDCVGHWQLSDKCMCGKRRSVYSVIYDYFNKF